MIRCSRSCGTTADNAIAQCEYVVVEPLEREAMQVGEVAGDMQLGHLPLAAR